MIRKLSLCFLIFVSCISFNPLFARHDSGRSDARRHNISRYDTGRHDVGRQYSNRHWDRGRQWDRRWNGNWGNNWWRYNRGYYPGYYNDYYYRDYYPATTTYTEYYPSTAASTYNNFIGTFTVASSGLQNGVYIIYLDNGMAFQMSSPGYDIIGSSVDVYSQGGSSFSLVINGEGYSASRVK